MDVEPYLARLGNPHVPSDLPPRPLPTPEVREVRPNQLLVTYLGQFGLTHGHTGAVFEEPVAGREDELPVLCRLTVQIELTAIFVLPDLEHGGRRLKLSEALGRGLRDLRSGEYCIPQCDSYQ